MQVTQNQRDLLSGFAQEILLLNFNAVAEKAANDQALTSVQLEDDQAGVDELHTVLMNLVDAGDIKTFTETLAVPFDVDSISPEYRTYVDTALSMMPQLSQQGGGGQGNGGWAENVDWTTVFCTVFGTFGVNCQGGGNGLPPDNTPPPPPPFNWTPVYIIVGVLAGTTILIVLLTQLPKWLGGKKK